MAIKDTVKKVNTATEIHPGPYVGVVLRVYENGNFDSIYNSVHAGAYDGWSVKVRIAEIHGHIPSPSSIGSKVSEEDHLIIEAHTTFRPSHTNGGKAPAPKPSPGDFVRVEYKNGSGVFLGTLKDSEGNNKKSFVPKDVNNSKKAFKKAQPGHP